MKILFSISSLACFSLGSIQIIDAMNQSAAIDDKTSLSTIAVETEALKAAEEVEKAATLLEQTANELEKAVAEAEYEEDIRVIKAVRRSGMYAGEITAEEITVYAHASAKANEEMNIEDVLAEAKKTVIAAKEATKKAVTADTKIRAINALVIVLAYEERIKRAAEELELTKE